MDSALWIVLCEYWVVDTGLVNTGYKIRYIHSCIFFRFYYFFSDFVSLFSPPLQFVVYFFFFFLLSIYTHPISYFFFFFYYYYYYYYVVWYSAGSHPPTLCIGTSSNQHCLFFGRKVLFFFSFVPVLPCVFFVFLSHGHMSK